MEVKQPMITVRCTTELHRALKQLAHVQQTSMNVLICDLLIMECKKAGLLEETKPQINQTFQDKTP